MITVHEALDRACAEVGIIVPRETREGRWIYTDTFERNGKNDGRVIIHEDMVWAKNWQTGGESTVKIGDVDPIVRKKAVERRQRDDLEKAKNALQAERVALALQRRTRTGVHGYMAKKGMHDIPRQIVSAKDVAEIAGAYMLAPGFEKALFLPIKPNGEQGKIASCQLVWPDGSKKFLAGGVVSGGMHRLKAGTSPKFTWICEGFATGLSIVNALTAMKRSDAVFMCFQASNIPIAARKHKNQVIIAADNDKPMEAFGGIGTGEHYARLSGCPYVMPPTLKSDFNDMFISEGIFAVQKMLMDTIRRANMRETA